MVPVVRVRGVRVSIRITAVSAWWWVSALQAALRRRAQAERQRGRLSALESDSNRKICSGKWRAADWEARTSANESAKGENAPSLSGRNSDGNGRDPPPPATATNGIG